MMLKLTVHPDPGYAVKELFFTYNRNTNSLYGIFTKYPDNKKLVLKEVVLPKVFMQPEGGAKQEIPLSLLFH